MATNLGMTFNRVYSASEKQDYGFGLGQIAYTPKGMYIFAKLGANITAGTNTFIAPDTYVSGTTATGKLTVKPGATATYSASADQYAFFLVCGIDDTGSVDVFKDFVIA